jgi:hypothetical protein
MLSDAVTTSSPWPMFRSEAALPRARLDELTALFEQDWTWEEHRTFYEAQIAVVPAELRPDWLQGLRERVASLTGLPLTSEVGLTLQIMEPGQFASVHSDRPLLGYEACRLVVQLSPGWRPGDGGEFTVQSTPEGPAERVFEPRFGSAVGFELHPDSHHEVRVTRRQRRTAVFHFHHAGNSAELAKALGELFEGMDFGALPEELDASIEEVEASVGEDGSFRACAVAWALWRWGCPVDTIRRGLEEAALEELPSACTAVLLAAWAARLAFEHADLRRWPGLAEDLADRPEERGRVQGFRDLAFPGCARPAGVRLPPFDPG